MILRQIGHELRGPREFVEGIVKLLLLPQDDSERVVESGILVVGGHGLAQIEFGLVKVLLAGLGRRFQQGCRDLQAPRWRIERFLNSARASNLSQPRRIRLGAARSGWEEWPGHAPRPGVRGGCWRLRR